MTIKDLLNVCERIVDRSLNVDLEDDFEASLDDEIYDYEFGWESVSGTTTDNKYFSISVGIVERLQENLED